THTALGHELGCTAPGTRETTMDHRDVEPHGYRHLGQAWVSASRSARAPCTASKAATCSRTGRSASPARTVIAWSTGSSPVTRPSTGVASSCTNGLLLCASGRGTG